MRSVVWFRIFYPHFVPNGTAQRRHCGLDPQPPEKKGMLKHLCFARSARQVQHDDEAMTRRTVALHSLRPLRSLCAPCGKKICVYLSNLRHLRAIKFVIRNF